jgi:hypothetical protein
MASRVRILKFTCLVVCVLSVSFIIAGRVPIRDVPVELAYASLYAAAFYGIQKRAPIVWKAGRIVLCFGVLDFFIETLPFTRKMPEASHPWVVRALILVGGTLVGLYWGFWWRRQKSYFSPGTNHES